MSRMWRGRLVAAAAALAWALERGRLLAGHAPDGRTHQAAVAGDAVIDVDHQVAGL